jgi:hypothetical protein
MPLDIIHHPIFIKNAVLFISKHNLSEVGFYLGLEVIPLLKYGLAPSIGPN